MNAAAAPLPAQERARRYLAKLPPAIEGQHGSDKAYHATCVLLHDFGLDEASTLDLLVADYNPRCIPPWSRDELEHKVRCAAADASLRGPRGHKLADRPPVQLAGLAGGASSQRRRKWPQPDVGQIEAIVAQGPDAVDLWQHSPVVTDDDNNEPGNAEEVVSALFATAVADPLLCVGMSWSNAKTRPLSHWLENKQLTCHQFIVPSAMLARSGKTKEGKESEHTLENTGQRQFLITEFDFKEFDDNGQPTQWAPLVRKWRAHGRSVHDACAALLWHLAGFAPLALAVHSGGKSLHGWFYCVGQTEEALRRFMRYAVSLGADHKMWTRSQFTRLPGGRREGGCRQSVFYFDPSVVTAGDSKLEDCP